MQPSSPAEQILSGPDSSGPVLRPFNYRIGFHYYPDTRHYRQKDLETWLPELCSLGASWITLLAEGDRAIPEPFLSGLLAASIQPVLHFTLPHPSRLIEPVEHPHGPGSLRLLLSNYARWGLRYACFYDRPNSRSRWRSSHWAQVNLVERFLDLFIPLAEMALEEGLVPVFPPLEPGGDYWDLAFLRTALSAMQRRGCTRILDTLVLGAYGLLDEGRQLDWGAGGPQRWPGAKPYMFQEDVQDQRGLYIADWYEAVADRELGKRLPVILLRGGARLPDGPDGAISQTNLLAHARQNLEVARLLSGDMGTDLQLAPLNGEMLACNFWLLATETGRACAAQAWFRPEGEHLPVVDAFRQWVAHWRRHEVSEENKVEQPDRVEPNDVPAEVIQAEKPAEQAPNGHHPINHYVLLPLYAWGAANWDMVAIQPLLEESHPTVGFSLAEARLARRVTVVGGEGAISVEALDMLRAAGCAVERILDDGTLIAT